MSSKKPARARSYSIRELTRTTGLSADVLRVWERRYGFPTPARDGAGARSYCEQDVEKLGLVQRALSRGHRVGNVIGQSVEELRVLLSATRPVGDLQTENGAVRRIMEALLADDDHSLVAELRYAALNLGPRPFVREVASALTELVGSAWERGQLQIRHEHVLTDALVTQLRVLWASGGAPRGERVLLATFPGEQHSLGLEMVGAYLASLGVTPRSMGPNVPTEEIAEAARAFDVVGVALSASRGSDLGTTQLHLNDLARGLGGRFPVAIGGALASRLTLPEGAQVIANWDAFERWVATVLSGSGPSGFGATFGGADRLSS